MSLKSAEYAILIKLKEYRSIVETYFWVQGATAVSEFLLRLNWREVNREHSVERVRNILKVETATLEILNLAHSALLKESLPATNSKE